MKQTVTPSNASVFLDALLDCGVRHVFANAGTDFAPVIEALVTAKEAGKEVPQFHIVPHENVAMAMASGYYLTSKNPVAVMVHVTVGTANAMCGLLNASRNNIPILLMAGKTPHTEFGDKGSKDVSIHWGQDSFDQGGMLREYVKWDYEMRAGQPVSTSVRRALDIAMTEPRGPVYLVLPRELLGAENISPDTDKVKIKPLGATPAVPDAAEIQGVAESLIRAEFPLMITAATGRNHANVALLDHLASEFAIGVAHAGEPGARDMNIPTRHPMYLGSHPKEAIQQADIIVVIDSEVPWWPRFVAPAEGAQLFQIGVDPLYTRYPVRGFPMDHFITGSSHRALSMLTEAMQKLAGEHMSTISNRRSKIAGMATQHQDAIVKMIEQASKITPVHPAWVAACINQVKQANTIIVNELGVPPDALDLTQPGTFIGTSPAAGLGAGLGLSLGARMGAPDRQVILVVGDGSYLFGNPLASHMVAISEHLPTLTVVMNNRRWHAVLRSTLAMYPDGHTAGSKASIPLVEFGNSPDYAAVMNACGGYGARVETPDTLMAALERGMEAVTSGQPALVEVITTTD
jgi:acetolactate synthase-1/2/3 large subunit